MGNLSLCFALTTDVGKKRNENQDCAGWYFKNDSALFLLADGMGGVSGGALASSLAICAVENNLAQNDGAIAAAELDTALDLANSAVYVYGKQNRHLTGMGTTIVGLLFSGQHPSIVSVGDSRIYKFSESKFRQLTRDQTLVQDLIDAGALRADEAEKNPISHVLTQSLGPTAALISKVERLSEEHSRGDRYLLCSDGLYNHMSNEEIASALSNIGHDPEVICQKLQTLALERGGSDNISILIVDVIDILSSRESLDTPQFYSTRLIESGDLGEKSMTDFLGVAVSERIKFQHLEEGPFSSAKLLLSDERSVEQVYKKPRQHSTISQVVTAFGIVVLGLLSAVLLVMKSPFSKEDTRFQAVGVIDSRFKDMVAADIRARASAERVVLSQVDEKQSVLDDPEVVQELNKANDLRIYTGPDLSAVVAPDSSTEPIDWDKEKLNFTSVAPVSVVEETIFSDAEKLDLALKKGFVRQLITELDLRLRLLAKNDRSYAQELLTAMEFSLITNGNVIDKVSTELSRLKSLNNGYQELKLRLDELGPMKIVDEISSVSAAAKIAKESYFDAVETFLAIHEQIPNNEEDEQRDHDRALALSGLIKQRRVELEETIRAELIAGLLGSTTRLGDYIFALSSLEARRGLLYGQIAILRTFTVISSKKRVEAERKDLQAKRKEAIANYLPVEEKFPIEAELQFRRQHNELF